MKNFIKKALNKKFYIFAAFTSLVVVILVTNLTTALFFNTSSTFSTIVIGDLDVTAEFTGELNGDLNLSTDALLPGETINRSLQISNLASSTDAYIRVQAIFEIDSGSGYEESLAVQMQLNSGQTNWSQGNSGPQFWYYYDTSLATSQTITTDLDFIIFPTATNDSYYIGNDEAGKPYKVTVKVEAIQAAFNAYDVWSPDYPTGWPS